MDIVQTLRASHRHALRRWVAAPNAPVFRVRRYLWVPLVAVVVAALGWGIVYGTGMFAAAPVPGVMSDDRRIQNARIDAMVKDILDRPLFSPDRKPPPPVVVAAAPPPVLKSRLSGITILPGAHQAFFTADGKTYTIVREGDGIDGFKVRSIQADRVTLASSFGEQVLQPTRGVPQTVRNTKVVELGKFDPDK